MADGPQNFGPRVLVVGRHNRHRSPMLEVLLGEAQSRFEVISAGIDPGEGIDPGAVRAMREIGHELEDHRPRPISTALDHHLALVAYVSPEVEVEGPIIATPGERVVLDVDNPRGPDGPGEEPLDAYRVVRDALRDKHLPELLRVLDEAVPG